MKTCPICRKMIKENDFVVAIVLGQPTNFDPEKLTYDLRISSQTISSHLYCVEAPIEVKNDAV